MIAYLVDADLLIDLLNGFQPTIDFIAILQQPGDVLTTAAVAIAETMTGITPARRPDVRAFLATFVCLDVTRDIAVRAGELRYDAFRRGRPLPATDALIAATAVENHAVLLTRNRRHFQGTGATVLGPS
ncbi:MAG TPA: PIN domain-containing protein [Chloroflexota bacterium]|nr:PIN domain-containing protein [Chloroflexota bacterium]